MNRRPRSIVLAALASWLALAAAAPAAPVDAPAPARPAAAQAGGGIVIQGGPRFKRQVQMALAQIRSTEVGAELLAKLENSSNTHLIKKTTQNNGSKNKLRNRRKASNGKGTGTTTLWEPDGTDRYDEDVDRDPTASLLHELQHACDADLGIRDATVDVVSGIKRNEIRATRIENLYRAAKGLPQRQKYGGKSLPPP